MKRWAEINLLRLIVESPQEFIQNIRPFSPKFLINRKSYVMAPSFGTKLFFGVGVKRVEDAAPRTRQRQAMVSGSANEGLDDEGRGNTTADYSDRISRLQY